MGCLCDRAFLSSVVFRLRGWGPESSTAIKALESQEASGSCFMYSKNEIHRGCFRNKCLIILLTQERAGRQSSWTAEGIPSIEVPLEYTTLKLIKA